MAEPLAPPVLRSPLGWLGIALTTIFVQLLPLDTRPTGLPWPDVLLAATIVWSLRRPDLLPVPLVAAVYLLADLLLQRPPGLMAALVVLMGEFLRSRASGLRGAAFGVEWLMAGVAVAGVALANRFVLGLVMTPQAPLGLTLLQGLMTVLFYPVIAMAAQILFGIRRPAPGEMNEKGERF